MLPVGCNKDKIVGTARERREKRRQRQQTQTTRPPEPRRQTRRPERRERPQIKLPGGRWLILIPAAIFIVFAVIIVLGALNPPDPTRAANAIWLDGRWSHRTPQPDAVRLLSSRLRQNEIGTLYVYVSSLKADNTWSGRLDQRNRFVEVEPFIASFVRELRTEYPEAELYAWVEVLATTADGYRLDSPQVQNIVAQFSQRAVETLEFDGVLLDVKPLFTDNEDYLALLREVRGAIGLNVPLAIAVSADLTPPDTDLNLPAAIAPGTAWSADYKQRLALQADQIVVTTYGSYLDNPVDYIEWVSYQVQAFTEAMGDVVADTGEAPLMISVPDYASNLPAHDAQVENLSAALDGIRRGLNALDDTQQTIIGGVALFSDEDPSDADWQLFREKWLTEP